MDSAHTHSPTEIHQTAILQAIRLAAQKFLQQADWQDNLSMLLRQLGEATDASRVYICQTVSDPLGIFHGHRVFEWCAPGIPTKSQKDLSPDIDLLSQNFSRWQEIFEKGNTLSGQIDSFPEIEREVLAEQGVQSLMVAPIFVQQVWWGYIGIDDCKVAREWKTEETNTLSAVAGILGDAILHAQLLERLHLTERIFKGLLERSEEGIVIIDSTGKVVEWNPAEEEITGIPRDEALTLYSWEAQFKTAPPEIQTPETLARIRERTLRLLQPDLTKIANETLLLEIHQGNGSVRHVESSIFPIEVFGGHMMGVISKDVTRQYTAQQELAESEARYRAIVQTQNELVCRISSEGRLLFVNEAFCRYYGQTQADLQGSSIFEKMIITEREAITAQLSDFLTNPREFIFENSSHLPGGEVRFQEWEIAPILDDAGHVTELQAVGHDITLQRQATELLRIQRDLAIALSATGDLDASLPLLLETATMIDGLDTGMVFLIDQGTGELELVASKGLGNGTPETNGPVERMKQGLSHLTEPLYLDGKSLSAMQSKGPAAMGLQSVVGLPIIYEGKRLGVLALASHTEYEIPAPARDAIESIAAQMGSVIRRLQSQADLIRSEQNLAALFDSLNDFLVVLDGHRRIIFANPVVNRRLGYQPDTLRASDIFSLIPESYHQRARSLLDHTTADKSTALEVPLLTRQNAQINVELVLSPGFWGGQKVIFGIGRDITARLAAAEAVQEQRRLAEALANIAAAVNATLNFEEVLDLILENISKVVPNDTANLMLIEDDVARVVRCRGYREHGTEEILLNKRFPLAELPVLQKIKQVRQLVILEDTTTFPDWVPTPEGGWIKSYIGAPIVVKDEVVGFINVDSFQAGFYTPFHASRLKAFTDQVGTAIQNARLFEETRRRARQLGLLNEITHLGLALPAMTDMLNMLADQLDAMFTASNVYITLWNEITGQAYLAASSRNVRPLIASMTAAIDPEELSLVTTALESGKPEFFEDLSQTRFISQRIVSYAPDHSALVLPLIADGKRLGAVIIGFHEGQRLPPQEISLAEHASAQIALTIARAQSLEIEQKRSAQLERANSVITALGKVATRVQHAPDLESVLVTLGAELDRLGLHSLVALRDRDGERLKMRYVSLNDSAQAFLKRVGVFDIQSVPVDSPNFQVLQELASKDSPTYLTNPIQLVRGNLPEPLATIATDLFRLVGLSSRTRSISLPLQVDERVIGLLGLWSDTLEASDVPAASTFAAQVAIAIEKTRLMDEVQELAITDDLTHVYNRRALFEFGKREVDMALRFDRPLTALMVDGDWFKAINDKQGHLIGDQVLVALADRLRKAVRDVDIVGRYGGDEFVVLLVEVDLPHAMHVARRLLAAINDQPFMTDSGVTSLTISIGAAACTTDTSSISDLIREADRALYIAKEAGRNRLATIQGVVK